MVPSTVSEALSTRVPQAAPLAGAESKRANDGWVAGALTWEVQGHSGACRA